MLEVKYIFDPPLPELFEPRSMIFDLLWRFS